MAMSKQVLDKLARNLAVMGEDVRRGSANQVIIENGSADITIAYADASFSPSMMGGVDGSASPFLGIGTGNPGKLTLSVASADTLAAVFTTEKAVKALAACASFANNIRVLQSDGVTLLTEVRGHSDLIGMGE